MSFSQSLRADKPKLEEYISTKKILGSIKEYQKSMPNKYGYRGSKIWDVLIKYVAEKEDSELLRSMLTGYYYKPERRSEYRRDMYKVLQKNPKFFLREFDKYYENNKFCLTWFFDKNKHNIQELDFKKFKNLRFNSLVNGKSVSSNESKLCKRIQSKYLKKNTK